MSKQGRIRATSRRGALAAAGIGVSAALALGVAPAAALVPTQRPNIAAGCWAGADNVEDAGNRLLHGPTADCTQARPAFITKLADGILGIFVDGVDLTALNGAAGLGAGSSATISGRGHATAIGGGLLPTSPGHATADAVDYFSAAIAAAGLGSSADAYALMGVGAAAAAFGGDANADAWPAGLAIAVSIDGQSTASARALGGFAMASSAGDRLVCNAVYATASLDGGGKDSSCTSILFLFHRYQNPGGPVSYAIKNPLSFTLTAPVGADGLGALGDLLDRLGAGAAADLLQTGLIPSFGSDLIRVAMHDDGPRLETDLVDWLRGLFSSGTTGSGDLAAAAQSSLDLLGGMGEVLGNAAGEAVEHAPSWEDVEAAAESASGPDGLGGEMPAPTPGDSPGASALTVESSEPAEQGDAAAGEVPSEEPDAPAGVTVAGADENDSAGDANAPTAEIGD